MNQDPVEGDKIKLSVFPLQLLIALLMVSADLPARSSQERPRVAVPEVGEDVPAIGENVPAVAGALVIDGRLDENVWARAARIDALTEVEPDAGAAADPATEILIMRDSTHLYVGFVCHEPEIDRLVLQDMHREGFQWEDDAVKITLDTFCDGKSGYYFLISAAGSRLDALVADNGQRRNYSWDGFWSGCTVIGSDRWTAEFAIPFKTLAFGPNGIWRANFERWRGVDRSRFRWTGTQREFAITTMSEAGELEIRDGLDQGYGIEIRPYMKVKRSKEHSPRSASIVGDGGGEINWQITPQLRTSLTFNTDFAETETDARRINLTRFSLFFPEKRDFFLQDANQFEFGWESGFSVMGRPDVLPYFSRRIGLSPDGEEIPIELGGRVTGRIGDLDLGALVARTASDRSAGVPAGELIVARPAWRINEELTFGGILTSGDPASNEANVVTGSDLKFATTDALPGLFTFNAFMLQSADEATHDFGSAYGARSSLKTSDWEYEFETLYTQDEFHPALGFVRRPGERRYQGAVSWEPRPDSGSIRNFGFSITPSAWTEPDGTIITKSLDTVLFSLEWHSGDRFYVNHTLSSDRTAVDFEPVDSAVISAGEYAWQAVATGFQFSRNRPLSGRVSYEGGGWYDGRKYALSVSGAWHPSANLEVGCQYRENRIRLPGGNATTRVETLNVNYDFSPDVRLATLVQADNVTDNLGLQSRFRWIHSDGREIFFVVNSSWFEEEDGTIIPVEQDFTVKLVYAVRF